MVSQFDDYALVDEEGEQAFREQEIGEASPSTPDVPQWMTVAPATPPTLQSLPEWLTTEDGDLQREVFLVTFAGILDATALSSPAPLRTLDG